MDETDVHAGRAQGGDEGGLIFLYERLAPALYTWARLRMRSPAGSGDAEDLVQEVWIRALDGFDRFEHRKPGSFRAWLFTIAANVFIEQMRNRGRNPASRASELATNVAAEVTSITAAVRRNESIGRLIETVQQLGADERRMFIHRGLEGLPAAEVAADLGISIEAAHKRWQRLKETLADNPAWQELVETD